jgi:hypothetical protein
VTRALGRATSSSRSTQNGGGFMATRRPTLPGLSPSRREIMQIAQPFVSGYCGRPRNVQAARGHARRVDETTNQEKRACSWPFGAHPGRRQWPTAMRNFFEPTRAKSWGRWATRSAPPAMEPRTASTPAARGPTSRDKARFPKSETRCDARWFAPRPRLSTTAAARCSLPP